MNFGGSQDYPFFVLPHKVSHGSCSGLVGFGIRVIAVYPRGASRQRVQPQDFHQVSGLELLHITNNLTAALAAVHLR